MGTGRPVAWRAAQTVAVNRVLTSVNSLGSTGRFAPAKWNTKSAFPRAARSVSPPVTRVTLTTSRWPSSPNRTRRLRPMNPSPPVTTTRTASVLGRCGVAPQHALHEGQVQQHVLHLGDVQLSGVVRGVVSSERDPGLP